MSRVTVQFRRLFRQNPNYRIPTQTVRNANKSEGNLTEVITKPMDPEKRDRLTASSLRAIR